MRTHPLPVVASILALLTACPDGPTAADAGPDAAPSGADATAVDGAQVDGGSQGHDAARNDASGTDARSTDAAMPHDGAMATDARRSDATPGSDAHSDECPRLEAHCTGFAARTACVETEQGRRRVTESCTAGSGCVAGECRASQCSDECSLHESGCDLFALARNDWTVVDEVGSTADRARSANASLRRDGLPAGGVTDRWYSDASLTNLVDVGGVGDSAIWTGTYLVAESLRLMATGSADAARSVESLVRTLHLWLHVSGMRGYLTRYAESADHPPAFVSNLDCGTNISHHCGFVYADPDRPQDPHTGERFNWHGSTSRDQYQGAMTGLALAYDATHDEELRELIRADVLEVVEELAETHEVWLKLIVNGTPWYKKITTAYVILNPAEQIDCDAPQCEGNKLAVVSFCTRDCAESIEDSADLKGGREFLPDMMTVFNQFSIIAALPLPAIPRSSSTIMLSSFFLTALHVTEGVPAYATRRAAIQAFYDANRQSWDDTSATWDYRRTCGAKYYGSNISFTPAFNYARLDSRPWVRETLLRDTMWPWVDTHLNAWYAFIVASHLPASAERTTIGAIGIDQTSKFPPPPYANVAVDRTQPPWSLPADPDCTASEGRATAAAENPMSVELRPAEGFQWQHGPWRLQGGADGNGVYPGVDYMVAYWMARHYGFMADDRPGVCARRR